ncbi:AtpZ/AtpI family protein [Sulfurimonas sp.]|uniref:AtpZ/AtpI family protein n=1 Tax=Sulfurimonas sp. TaxID=2022749 RepID=UPI00286DAF81|nr:AtpZ/AtpI family protein [Sulfurimonas sp.]
MHSDDKKEQKAPRIKPIIEAADNLSLGISMVVAVLMGVGIGILLKNLTGYSWTLWVGVFIGIAAAVLNVYKAYSKQYKEYEELAKEPRYAIKKQLQDDDDEDDSEKNY